MGAFGQWGNGPIQFNSNSGVIESRGTIDKPSDAAGPQTQPTAPSPTGGGVLPDVDGPKTTDTGPQTQPGPNPGWGSGDMPAPVQAGGASNNGGGYGMGGAGLDGGGDTSGGSVAFDDGGEVPDDPAEQDGVGSQQGAQASTIDPMMAIQRTLAYGRKKMGMPSNFTQGPAAQQSFDDGGEVEEGGDSGVISTSNSPQQGQNGMPDPRHTLMYLTGAGNVSPDIADALEQKLDPQGQMDASTRTIHAIASAPSPDAAFGLMQHYRTRYNAYAGGARAALDQGNAGQAAAHATQAFQNIPTGYDVRFAPAQGGIAMSAKKLGPQADERFSGVEPSTNIEDRRGEEPKADANGLLPSKTWTDTGRRLKNKLHDFKSSVMGFDDGGEVESENIEDRRGEHGEGFVPKGDGPSPESAGNGALTDYADGRSQDDKQARNRAELRNQGVVFKDKVQGFDDGGEVDDEGVIPEQTMEEPADPQTDQPQDPSVGQEPDWGQPNVLTPEQFKKVVAAGYDKPLDDGFGKFMSSILQAVNPVGSAQAAEATPGQAPAAGNGQPWTPVQAVKSLFTKPGQAAPDVTAAVTDPSQTPAGQSGPTPNQQPPGGQRWQPTPSIMAQARNQPGQQTGMQESTTGKTNAMDTRQRAPQAAQQPGQQHPSLDQMYDKYDALWTRMHNGSVSTADEPQRRKFIEGMIDRELKTHDTMDIETNKNRLGMQAERDKNRMLTEQFKQTQITARNQNTTQSRESIANLNRIWNTWSKQQQDMVRMAGQQLAADPSLAKDPNKLMERVSGLAQQMRIDPQAMMQLIQNGGPPQAPRPEGGSQPPGTQPQQGGQTIVVFPRGPYAGKPMIKLPNGNFVPAGQ